jgi:uncharacterized repeat protein (TIGR03803 family)
MRRGKLETMGIACLILTVIPVCAQNFKTLVNFNGANGANPFTTGLTQGANGNLYGATFGGGSNGAGIAFEMTLNGELSVLHNFCSYPNCSDGYNPISTLVLATDGNFYGTTEGNIFKITPTGTLTTLWADCTLPNCADGAVSWGVVQGADGNFYATTIIGGTGCPATFQGCGTVFKLTPEGVLTILHEFCPGNGSCPDGGNPFAPMVEGNDGNFYGTTQMGTVFRITPEGNFRTLYTFCSQPNCADGATPQAPLVQAADGNFYGTSNGGGSFHQGTVFRITPGGHLTTLYSFCAQINCPDGTQVYGGLIQATDGNFYGMAGYGGMFGHGTVFKLTPGGMLTTLHDFDGADGSVLLGSALVQHTNGTLYGVTYSGGSNNDGTVFSLDVGLGPFIKTVPTSGQFGQSVTILGTNLTGATSVRFNHKEASFTIVSASEIDTTVPNGASTGFVTVTTPSGIPTSNVLFQVLHTGE